MPISMYSSFLLFSLLNNQTIYVIACITKRFACNFHSINLIPYFNFLNSLLLPSLGLTFSSNFLTSKNNYFNFFLFNNKMIWGHRFSCKYSSDDIPPALINYCSLYLSFVDILTIWLPSPAWHKGCLGEHMNISKGLEALLSFKNKNKNYL